MEGKYPQIFHLGLPKTGTTTIQDILRQDNRLNLHQTRYFNTAEYWLKNYDQKVDDGVITINSEENLILQSGNFGKLELTLSRIKKCSPEAKIILTIREQRSMLESRYKYCIPYYEGHYFEFDEWLMSGQGMDYLSISMYHSIYKGLNAFFPKENIFFLFFEDLKSEPIKFYREFYKILGLTVPEHLNLNLHSNPSLTESELGVIKRLNRYKLFRKESRIAKFEERIFRKIAKRFKSRPTRRNTFKWGTTHFFKNIEKDFAYENNAMIQEGIFSLDKLKKYNYLT